MTPKKLDTFLEFLPQGPFLRKAFTYLLWVAAGVLVFAGLFYIIDLIMYLPNTQHPAGALGTLIAVLIAAAGVGMALMVVLFRARDIQDYPPQTYSITHLSAQLLRVTGELQAIFHLVAGFSAGIMYWFGGQPRLPYFDSLMWRLLHFAAYPPFISGLFTILACLLQAAITLIAFYLLAELLLIFRDIALKNR
jgi:NADH:ubiquinone oxidoreductase subunit K